MNNIELLKFDLSTLYQKTLSEILNSINYKNLNEKSKITLTYLKKNNGNIYSDKLANNLKNKIILYYYYKIAN